MSQIYRVIALQFALAISALCIGSVCAGQQSTAPVISLRYPVEISAEERAFVQALPTLQVSPYQHIPPMSFYDAQTESFQGISVDVFRFIAEHIGLSYHFVVDEGLYVDKLIEEFEQGQFDTLIPVSYNPERAKLGLFTDTYYEGFYALITRKAEQIQISSPEQLKQYRVGVIEKAAAVPYVQSLVPELKTYAFNDGNTLYEALRANDIDIAVFNQSVFAQDRYRLELFDLEDIYTLYDYPRAYGFLFQNSTDNARLVDIFNRYIAAIDSSRSVRQHENGEQRLISKYIEQQNQQKLLWLVLLLGAAVLIIVYRAYRSHQRIAAELVRSHQRIVRQHEALQEANRRLEHLSRTDVLTGLSNRRDFDERFNIEFSRHQRSAEPLSVLMVDIDFFKHINDDYGHEVGDVYLQKIAEVLTAMMVRSTDLVARYGGEEFVCLLPETDSDGAVNVAEQLREAVMVLHAQCADVLPRAITVSVGVATLQGASCNQHQLVKQADTQLYRAKDSGRNCVRSIVLDHSVQCCEPLPLRSST